MSADASKGASAREYLDRLVELLSE